jgi:hypothetical protein
LRLPNSKKSSRVFCQILFLQKLYTFWLEYKLKRSCESVPHFLTPQNSFGKTESALFRHLPEYLYGQNTKEKCPFLFRRNFTPAKSEMQGVFFFRGCRGSARQWRNDTSVRSSLEPPRAPRVRLVLSFKIGSSK